jgi:hypothetical protein
MEPWDEYREVAWLRGKAAPLQAFESTHAPRQRNGFKDEDDDDYGEGDYTA